MFNATKSDDKVKEKKIKLSSKGLAQVNYSLYEKDFTFSFKGSEFKCPTFIAEFVSKKVSKQREKDPTINKINIDFEVKHEETFGKLNKLISGESIDSDNDEIVSLLINIGNEDSINIDNELSIDNVIAKLNFKHSLDFDSKQEIEFIAEHFEEMKEKEIGSDFLPLILDSNKLKLNNEKSLLDFVIEQVEKDRKNICLVKYIHCEYLSKGEELEAYVKLLDSIESNEIIGSLWPSLRKHFIVKETVNKERFLKEKGIEFKQGNGNFNGIIKYLSDECGGNIIDKSIITVTSSSNSSSTCPIRSVVQEEGDWGTSNKNEESWLKFDFKDRKVLLEGYSLRSNSPNWNTIHHIRSWYLEGSHDDSKWEVIDQRNDQECLNGNLREATYSCSSKEEYRYLRFRRIGYSWGGNCYYLPINRVEFFGKLIGKNDN